MLGNDDAPELADVLRSGTRSTYAEDGIVELPGGFEMASCGYSTPTPWNTPRELPEDEIERPADRGSRTVSATPSARSSTFTARRRGRISTRRQVWTRSCGWSRRGRRSRWSRSGSTAVRAVIERYGPMLGLHGHVHESPGAQKVGRTLCINPGSEYSDGVLRGAIVDLEGRAGVRAGRSSRGEERAE